MKAEKYFVNEKYILIVTYDYLLNVNIVEERVKMSKQIDGSDGASWVLPLSFDDPTQPLYR